MKAMEWRWQEPCGAKGSTSEVEDDGWMTCKG